jgi:hypothetical protein
MRRLPNAEHAQGHWFERDGRLAKALFQGLEIRRSEFRDFAGVPIARQIRVLKNGELGMLIRIDYGSSTGEVSPKIFELRGHEWNCAFTDEVR